VTLLKWLESVFRHAHDPMLADPQHSKHLRQADEMRRKPTHDFWCEIRAPGVYLEEVGVDVVWTPLLSMTAESPAEGGYEITRVTWNEVDIYSALSDEALGEIQRKIFDE
jgi:hypothetical protein